MSEDPRYFHYAGWAEAFTIFAEYVDPDEKVHHVAAEHDEIFAGPPPERLPLADLNRLAALGWRPDTDLGCFKKFT